MATQTSSKGEAQGREIEIESKSLQISDLYKPNQDKFFEFCSNPKDFIIFIYFYSLTTTVVGKFS